MKHSVIDITQVEIDIEQFKEIVKSHPFVDQEELREKLQDMVKIHAHQESLGKDGNPLVGISPCFLIPVLYELIVRRFKGGDLDINPDKVLVQ